MRTPGISLPEDELEVIDLSFGPLGYQNRSELVRAAVQEKVRPTVEQPDQCTRTGVSLPDELVTEIDQAVDQLGYQSRSELVRCAVRDKLQKQYPRLPSDVRAYYSRSGSVRASE